jgi:competence protein ComGF
MMKDYQKKILSLFIELELRLAELYRQLAERFIEEGAFFTEQYREELKHAQWIEYFMNKVEKGEILFHEDKTRTMTLTTFLGHVQMIIGQANDSNLSLLKALSLVASIEDSLIERKVLEHFDVGAPELRSLMVKLKNETSEHAAKIKQLWKKHATVRA